MESFVFDKVCEPMNVHLNAGAVERDMVLCYGLDGEACVRCAITGEALDDHFQGARKDKLEVFRANRQPIEQEVQRRYLAGDTELDGSILIRSGDLL